MSEFDKKLTTAPIYNSFSTTKKPILPGVPTPKGTPQDHHDQQEQSVKSEWQKWLQQVHNYVSANESYGNPSVLLNSDFYWNDGVTSPIDQGDGNGAFFSEKWQVQGAAVALYTLTRTTISGNSSDNIGSLYYMNVDVTSYSGTVGDLYLYQQQDGSQFLRRYQNRTINMSAKIVNNGTTSIDLRYQLYYFYDPTDTVTPFQTGTLQIKPGLNEISSALKIPLIGSTSIGASPYIQFRLVITQVCNFDLYYLKAEMSDLPSVLYVDHALERVRIDNS